MRHKRVITLGAALVLLQTACGQKHSSPTSEAQSDQKLHWLANFETAKAQARVERKKLLMLFTGSDWCPPCLMLEKEVFKQPEFSDYAASHLVLLKVDFPRIKMQSLEEKAANEKLAEQYGIYGFPTVVILDSSGKTIGELGYMPGGPKPFIAALEKLSGGEEASRSGK